VETVGLRVGKILGFVHSDTPIEAGTVENFHAGQKRTEPCYVVRYEKDEFICFESELARKAGSLARRRMPT
jgi:hypothetical protein